MYQTVTSQPQLVQFLTDNLVNKNLGVKPRNELGGEYQVVAAVWAANQGAQ